MIIHYALETKKSPHHKFNEDAAFFVQTNEQLALAAVCDGISGKPFGWIAAHFVASNLKRYFQSFDFTNFHNVNYFDWIMLIIRKIQRKLKLLAIEDQVYFSMGTTLTFLLMTPNSFYLVNVGNSRCYYYLNTLNSKWEQLTKDHNILNAPLFSKHYNPNFAWKKTLNAKNWNQLLSYVSPRKNLIINILKLEMQPGYYLLSTDGLHDFLFPSNFATLKFSKYLSETLKILVQQAVANGSEDDVTGVMLKVQ